MRGKNIHNPLISVVIPCYNSQSTISETLDSVLAQTYTNYEVIVVDDGSTDTSAFILDKYQNTNPKIQIVYQENRGLPGARNTGIANSKGELIAILDADDTWHSDKLKLHVEHFSNNSKLGISYSRSEFMDRNSHKLGSYQMPPLANITPLKILTENPCGNGSAPVILRTVLDEVKYYDPKRGYSCWFDEDFKRAEDVELWLRICLTTNWVIEGIPQALTYYRINDKGLSADIDKQLQSMQMVLDKTATYASKFINQHRSFANAYQYRYLARRAVRSKDKNNAIKYIHKALLADLRILTTSFRRTFLTLAASYMLFIFPESGYTLIENLSLKITGAKQRSLIKTKRSI